MPAIESRSPEPSESLEDASRLERVLERHFDPRWGSAYWLERERELGIDARREIRSVDDLPLLGCMDGEAMVRRSVWDFVPRSLQADRSRFVAAETAGTLGAPKRTVFHDDDFRAAFVAPFVAAVERAGLFPRGARWIWIGPGGPHVIGKAAREVCRALGSPDPFSVDFDPRWYKAQRQGSLGRELYLRHVIDQALAIFRAEPIDVIFSTPTVVAALGARLPEELRERVAAIHLGGLPAAAAAEAIEACFPRAGVLSGYGNSLLGVCPQVEEEDLRRPSYYPHGERLRFDLVPPDFDAGTWRGEVVPCGARGRVMATRLDPSGLIAGLLERDTAVRLPPRPELERFGFVQEGLGDPRPLEEVGEERLGIY
jgi:hypothetical protein